MIGNKILGQIRMFHRRKLYGSQLFYQVRYFYRYKRLRHLSRRCRKLFFWGNLLLVSVIAWTISCEPAAHREPVYGKKELTQILSHTSLSTEDYQELMFQTGFSPKLIEELRSVGREEEIYIAQQQFFKEVHVRCEAGSILTREEFIVDEDGNLTKGMSIPMVENGDILITLCSHCLGWRNGHAAIVVDAEKRLVLEAQVMGKPSCITSLDHWEYYPSFLVLRLKDTEAPIRQEIAEYAKSKLVDIPYQLTTLTNKTIQKKLSQELQEQTLAGTQCAHLVWYAYYQAGYDLDSDGGMVVTPSDLAESPLLEIVQFYGMP